MPDGILVSRSYVEHGDRAFGEPFCQFGAAHWLGSVFATRETPQDALDSRQVPFGDDAQKVHQRQGLGVGKPIDHRLAIAPAGDKSRPTQLLKMLRAVGKTQTGLLSERFHATLSLRELLEDHEPCRCGKGARNERVFLQQSEFRAN